MHIAFFTNSYRPVISGVVRSITLFRKALSDLGHNVFIFAQKAEGYTDDEPFIFRYPRLPIPLPGDCPASLPISNFINQLLPCLKLDIIHTHHPIMIGEAGMVKARELNLPLVFTFHSQYDEYGQYYFPIQQEKVQDFVRDLVVTWVDDYLRHCTHIIVPSYSMLELLTKTYKVRDCVTVIPTGIDLSSYQLADGTAIRRQLGWQNNRVMVTAGRLAPEKNLKTVLRAFSIASQSVPELRLLIIGDGPERGALEQMAQKMGLSALVHFTGLISLENMPAYLKAGDFFCMASTVETQGLVTMEAMAAGLPPVAVDAVGTRDIVDDNLNGFLTQNSSQSLAEAILRICSETDILSRMKAACIQKAESFSIYRQAEKLLEVYHQAIVDKKAGKTVTVGDG